MGFSIPKCASGKGGRGSSTLEVAVEWTVLDTHVLPSGLSVIIENNLVLGDT